MKKLAVVILLGLLTILVIVSVAVYNAAKNNPITTTLVPIGTSSNSIIPDSLHHYILIKNWDVGETLPQGAKVVVTPNGGIGYFIPVFSSKVYK